MKVESATIFAIKRYALHDGPNLRTTIFFKGCPLSCHWCHNPEGIDFEIEVISLTEKCVGCHECISVCSENALKLTETGITRNSSDCTLCLKCVDCCPALTHEATGQIVSTRDLMQEIEKDLVFYDQSGGGVTFSGGEPLSQPKALLQLLIECGKLELHRAVDTSGQAPTSVLLDIAEHTDLFLFDIKHIDNDIHKKYTGTGNTQILKNFKALAERNIPIRVRIPLMAGINDDDNNLALTGQLIAESPNVQGVDVLPYHPSARAKYRKLDMKYLGENFQAPTSERVAEIADMFRRFVSDVHIGG